MDLQEKARKEITDFETFFREFIKSSLSDGYPKDWTRGIPKPTGGGKGMLDGWKRRKKSDFIKGLETSERLIDQANFSDYKKIIENERNWKNVYSEIFHDINKRKVSQALDDLTDFRNKVFHNKGPIEEDELGFHKVNIRWIKRKVQRKYGIPLGVKRVSKKDVGDRRRDEKEIITALMEKEKGVVIRDPGAGKDRKEIHVVITKKNEGIPSITAIEQKCVEVYRDMEKRCLDELNKLKEKERVNEALTTEEGERMHFLSRQHSNLVRQREEYQKDKSKKEDRTKYHVKPTINRHRDRIKKAVYEMRDITGADLDFTGIRNDNDFLEFCLKDFSETWLVQEIPQTTLTGDIRRQIKIVNRHLHGQEEKHNDVLIILFFYQKLSYDEKASLLNQLQIFHSTESLSKKIRFKVWDRTQV